MTTEEHKKIINTFIEHHLSNHYYAWAIHDKVGTMDNVQNHPHVHIMFSTKENDDVEKIRNDLRNFISKNIISDIRIEAVHEKQKNGLAKKGTNI